MDTDGGNFISIHIDTSLAFNTLSLNIKSVQRVYDSLFKLSIIEFEHCSVYKAQIGVEIFNIIVEVDNGIGNELSRSMVCNLVITPNETT